MTRFQRLCKQMVERWQHRDGIAGPAGAAGASDRGDTLVEVLLAIVVLGIACVALLTAFATSISASAEHRQLASLDSSTRIAANQAIADVQQQAQSATPNPFVCPNTWTPNFTDVGNGYTAAVQQVAYWNGSAFVAGAANCVSYSPQQYTLQISSTAAGTPSTQVSTVIYDPGVPPAPDGAGSPTQLVWLQQPGGGTAGTPLVPQPSVAVEDGAGNIATNDFSSVTLQVVSGPGTFSSTCSGVETYGVVQFSNCSLSLAGSYVIQAVDVGLTPAAQVPVAVGVAPPAKLVLTGAQSGTASNSATLGKITVTSEDVFGNATTNGATVSLTSSSTRGIFATSSGGAVVTSVTIPAGSSSATFYYGDTVAGSPTVTASAPGMASGTQTETITAGNASKVGFTNAPFTAGASTSATSQLTVSIEDQFGNPTTRTGTTVVNLASSSTGGKFSASSGGSSITSVSIASGNKSGTAFYGDSVVGSPTLTASATNLTSGTQQETITTGPKQLVFATPPVTGNAYTDANIGPITVTEEDAAGNPTTVGVTVNLSSSSTGTYILNTTLGATTPTGANSVTIPAGQSSVTFYYGDTKPGTPTITAAATGLSSATQNETITVGPVASYKLSNPGTQAAGTAFNETITAVDAAGNTVTSVAGTQCLIFSGPDNSPSGTSPAYPAQGTCPSGSAVPFTNGVGTASVTLYDAESTTITAASGLIVGTSPSFTVNGGPAATFNVADPGAPVAGTSFTLSITATDTWGNTANTYTGAKTVTFSGPANSPSGKAPTYPASVTFTAGTGSATITLYDAQTTTLTAKQGTLTDTTDPFTVSPGAVSTLGIGTIGTQTAGTPFNATITAKDAYGNGLSGPTIFTFSGPGNSPNGTAPSYPPSVTLTNGTGTAAVTLYKAATGVTIKVASGSVNTTSNTFTVNAGASGTFTLSTPSPTAGTAFNETLTAGDTYGNPTTSYAGTKTVIFTGPANSPAPTNKAPTYPATVAFTNGVGTASITLFDAQSTTLTATQGTVTGTSASFTVASGGLKSFTIPTTPAGQTAGVGFTVAVQATDAFSNPFTGTVSTGLQFTGPHNSPAPSNTAPSYPTSLSFSGGTATAAITLFDAETTSLTVSATGVSAGISGTFAVAPGSGSGFTLSTPTPTAGVAFTENLSASDAYSNPATGFTGSQALTFTGPANAPNLAAPSYPATVAFTNGVGTASITLFDAQTTTLRATAGAVTGITPSFTVAPGTAKTLTATAGANQSATVSTAFATKLGATATDTWGNGVTGVAVTFTGPNSGASITFAACTANPQTYSCTTNTSGTGLATSSTFTANGTNGSYNITASAPGLTSTTFAEANKGNQSITITSGAPSQATVGGTTYTPTATASSGLAVAITVDASSSTVCSINGGGVVSFLAAGTCTLDFNQSGSTTWNAAPQLQQSFTVKRSQTITITSTAPAHAAVGGATYTPTATASSGLAVAITVDSSSSAVCSINGGGAVSFQTVGTCTLDFNQSGSTTWYAAPQLQQGFAVAKGTQTVSFTSTAPANETVGGATYTPTATATSGLTVAITVDSSSSAVCSINGGGVVSFQGAGTCTLDANQAGNANWNAATQLQQSFSVVKRSQTISFTSTAPTNETIGGATYTPTATSTSALTVAITVDASSSTVCSINGSGVVSFQGTGTCTLDANQAGNATWNAATQVQQPVTVTGAPTVVTLANGSGTLAEGDTATVTFNVALQASSICSTWTTNAFHSLANATITFTNNGNNDTFAVTTPTATCSGQGNFGTIATGASYVSGTVTFTGSSVAWNPTGDKLTFTLGNVATGSNRISTGVAAGFPGYTADPQMTDTSGNPVSATTFTSTTKTGF